MSDYTPTTHALRCYYMDQGVSPWDREQYGDEFDRWHAAEKAKWQAEALRAAADAMSGLPAEDWRRAYPDQHLESVADAIDPEVRADEVQKRSAWS